LQNFHVRSTLPVVRYLAWIAVFSLQLGMLVCSAGVDVCHAADAPAHIQLSSSQSSDNHHQADPLATCAAHAAHVFLGQPAFCQTQSALQLEAITQLASLNLPEILHSIEQPPKTSHS